TPSDPARNPIPNHLVTTIGVPIVLGELEVTPLAVERRPVVAYSQTRNKPNPERITASKDALVLRLKLKNVSHDVVFNPTDPCFDRNPRDAGDKPYTLVEVGKNYFYGGVIEYLTDAVDVSREWLEGQENDNRVLRPGEERQTVVATHPKQPAISA